MRQNKKVRTDEFVGLCVGGPASGRIEKSDAEVLDFGVDNYDEGAAVDPTDTATVFQYHQHEIVVGGAWDESFKFWVPASIEQGPMRTAHVLKTLNAFYAENQGR